MPASLTCEQVELWLEIADPAQWTEPTSAWDYSRWDNVGGTRWLFEGVAGSYMSFPAATNLNISDSVEITVRVQPTKWIADWGDGHQGFVHKGLQYGFGINPAGRLQFTSSDGVTHQNVCTVDPPVPDNTPVWLRVTRDRWMSQVKFWWAPDQIDMPPTFPTSAWTQLGATVPGPSTAAVNSAEGLNIGHLDSTGARPFKGRIAEVRVRSGIDEAAWIVAAVEEANSTIGNSTFVATSGQTVTVHDPDILQEGAGQNPAIWAVETSEGAGWVNAISDNSGFVIDRGRQSGWDDIDAAFTEFDLDNTSGRYSVYGSVAYPRVRPGLGVHIYASWGDERYSLFQGDVTEWREEQDPTSNKIHVKAVDASRLLADPINVNYNAGNDYEGVGARIQRLLDRAMFAGRRSIAPGTATLTNYATTRTILDEIRMSARSDGGLFFIDNDGTAVYLNRHRFLGRPTTNPMPVFGDSCDTNELPYAAIEPVIADHEFGNVVAISNVSQGNESAETRIAANTDSITLNGRWLWSPDQLVICNVEHLQDLADWELMRRSAVYYRVGTFEVFPVHDIRLWPIMLGLRIGDIVKVIRRPPNSTPLNVNSLVDGLRIEATPVLWKFTVRCSPGTLRDDIVFWDVNANWDEDVWV